jgi:hypothetical protein
MILVIRRIDVISETINNGLSRTIKAPLCVVVGAIGFVVEDAPVGGVIVETDVDVDIDDCEVGELLVVGTVTVIVAVVVVDEAVVVSVTLIV